MKTLKSIAMIGAIALATSCTKSSEDITGTYVLSFKDDYSMATDTINISCFNAQSGTYEVERRAGFHRIKDGKVQPKEYRQEHWMATYDQSKAVLQETAYGRQVYVNANAHTLSYNGLYRKIK